MIALIIFPVLLTCVNGVGEPGGLGPFKVVIKEFGPCKNQGTHFRLYDTRVRVVKRNAPLMFDTNFTNELPLDNSVEATLIASFWGNGGWKDNFWTQKLGGVCTSLNALIPDFFQRMLESMNLKKCPIPAGNHTMSNFELKLTFNVPMARYGKYKADVKFGNKQVPRFGCLNVVFDVVPKKGHASF